MTLKYDFFLYPFLVKNPSLSTYPFGKTTGKQISLTLPLALPKAMRFLEGDLAAFSKSRYAFLFFSNPTMLLAELDIMETAATSMKKMYAQGYLLKHYLRQQKSCSLNVQYKAVLYLYIYNVGVFKNSCTKKASRKSVLRCPLIF